MNQEINEKLLKQIQEWTNNVPLIVLGSGASIPYGLPGMGRLGEYLKQNINFTAEQNEEQQQFESFKNKLDKTNNLEEALSNLNLSEQVTSSIVNKTWEMINQADIELFEQVITKNKTFSLTRLLEHYLNTSGEKATIVTTNYDRIAEYASNLANASVVNGFSYNYVGKFSDNFNFKPRNTRQINLLKVHGSLDWFKQKDGNIIQLPLQKQLLTPLSPLIVTPGTSKYAETHYEPYRTIITESDKAINNATGFLCVGYGFNDSHVQTKIIEQIKKNKKPIIMITRNLTDSAREIINSGECDNYIFIESESENNTKFYSSQFGEHIIENSKYWSLDEYLTMIL